ncbi:MAG TPA: glycosyltransferase family 2 protein [Bacteroidota bacterium]|jgi:cellulose synthase/poly-beta-1,6-N-acetylglucosamine synthase-like glycosyltransferase
MALAVIELAAGSLIGFLLGYLVCLSGLAFFDRGMPQARGPGLKKFVCIIPAHNEETVLERTVRSVMSGDYPAGRLRVIVVADNCTDRTADVARSAGAAAWERRDTALKGKGHALRWCFDRLAGSGEEYDALVVVDADSEVSADFFRVLNLYLENGARVVQAADIVRPRPGIWSSEITRAGFTLYNVARPLGRKSIGCSAGLRGNGMCFSREILAAVPWSAYSLAEDLEYGIVLLLHGVPVTFAPEAQVIATMPAEARHAESQRARWEAGRLPVIRRYAPLLAREIVKEKSFRLFDALLDLLMPPLVTMLAFVSLLAGTHLLLAAAGWTAALPYALMWFGILALGMSHALLGLIAVRADKSLYRALLYVPWYAAWKLMLYGRLILRGTPQRWIRTAREAGDPRFHDFSHRSTH